MIKNPSDYRYVDFAAGDMPTERFNGEILPIRIDKNVIKGEDIAFLYEAAAERLRVCDGAETGAGFVYHAPEVDPLIPSRKLSADQMNTITRNVNDVERMKPLPDFSKYESEKGMIAVGFLESDLEEVTAMSFQDGLMGIYREHILPHCVSGEISTVRAGDQMLLSHILEHYKIIKPSQVIVCNALSSSRFGTMKLIDGSSSTVISSDAYRQQQFFVTLRNIHRGDGITEYSVYASSNTPIGRIPKSSVKSVDRVFASFSGPDLHNYAGPSKDKQSLMNITDCVIINETEDYFEITMSEKNRLQFFIRFVSECGGVWPDKDVMSERYGYNGFMIFRPYIICTLNDRTTWQDLVGRQ